MSRFRVYIKPFQPDGTYAADYIEVTRDVIAGQLGAIQETIDKDNYEVGLFRFNQFTLALTNFDGTYSEVGDSTTMFSYKRSDSLVKITWQIVDDITQCGNAICGEAILSDEKDIFFGLLNDESLSLGAKEQILNFSVLGLESIFERVEVPFASINNGDLLSAALLTMLDQPVITTLMAVSGATINLGTDLTIDDKSTLENKTVKEALDEILLSSNSILYVRDGILHISDRTASASLSQTFYGQAAVDGIEDLLKIEKIRNGLNKLYNYWTWSGSTNVAEDTASVTQYGVKKSTVKGDIITDGTKRNTVLGSLRDEFSTLRQEMMITVPFDYSTLELYILDRIAIDYPTVFIPGDENPLPQYDVSLYDVAVYPIAKWTLEIDANDRYKILGRKVDFKKQTITFKIKKI